MITGRKFDYGRNQNKESHLSLRRTIGILSLVGGIIVAGVGIRSDILGNKGKLMSKDLAQMKALSEYESIYKTSSPVGKFILQYLVKVSFDQLIYPNASGKVANMVDGYNGSKGMYWLTTIGSSCLKQSAYDVTAGSVEISLAQSVNSKPTILMPGHAYGEISSTHPDVLVINSNQKNKPPLYFTGIKNRKAISLAPANQETKNILTSFGCVDTIITSKS